RATRDAPHLAVRAARRRRSPAHRVRRLGDAGPVTRHPRRAWDGGGGRRTVRPPADTRSLVVPNAGNREAVTVALGERVEGFDATLDDASLVTALVAVQGPRAAGVLPPVT